MPCALCLQPTSDTVRTSGLEFCNPCRIQDPRDALKTHHEIEVAWDTRMLRFNAGMGIPELDPTFWVKCVPKRWPHRFFGFIWPAVDIGDDEFDRRIYARGSDPARVRAVLRHEGVQSAILALLTSVRDNELLGNHVELAGPTLTIGVRPQGAHDEARMQEFKLEAAALALHLRAVA